MYSRACILHIHRSLRDSFSPLHPSMLWAPRYLPYSCHVTLSASSALDAVSLRVGTSETAICSRLASGPPFVFLSVWTRPGSAEPFKKHSFSRAFLLHYTPYLIFRRPGAISPAAASSPRGFDHIACLLVRTSTEILICPVVCLVEHPARDVERSPAQVEQGGGREYRHIAQRRAAAQACSKWSRRRGEE